MQKSATSSSSGLFCLWRTQGNLIPGIPPEIQGKLFEPFATHGKSGSTGLGLAIVKQIAEADAGSLSVQSSPLGATFTLPGSGVAAGASPGDGQAPDMFVMGGRILRRG